MTWLLFLILQELSCEFCVLADEVPLQTGRQALGTRSLFNRLIDPEDV